MYLIYSNKYLFSIFILQMLILITLLVDDSSIFYPIMILSSYVNYDS